MVGVGAVVVSHEEVLLIQRGRDPLKGAWSLPGGALKLAERIPDGIIREVREEAGLAVRAIELIDVFDHISRDPNGSVQFHYVLLDWLCTPVSGPENGSQPPLHAGSDAQAALWADPASLHTLDLTADTVSVIRRALRRAKELNL